MSINVTVNGNTVSRSRARMVSTSDVDFDKNDFQKRRRIRLEQVRQQSKDIAEQVRNKVRNEKHRQLSDLEKQGESDRRRWQAKRLLSLQRQYQECLKDLGMGHVQAALEEESDEAEEMRQRNFAKLADHRGQKAFERLNQEKQANESERNLRESKRKYNQIVEKARAAVLTNVKKKRSKKSRQLSTNINISSRLSGGSDTENESPRNCNFSSRCRSPSPNNTCLSPRSRTSSPVNVCKQYSRPTDTICPHPQSQFVQTCPIPTISEACQNSDHIDDCVPSDKRYLEPLLPAPTYVMDTRISDRIRSRSGTDGEKKAGDKHGQSKSPPRNAVHIESQSPPSERKTTKSPDLRKSSPTKVLTKPGTSHDRPNSQTIPKRPSITVRSTCLDKESPKKTGRSMQSECDPTCDRECNKKTQFYDHKNRFSKQYTDKNVKVHKINEESIEVCPGSASECESYYKEKMYKRDKDAIVRGKKAIQKAKVQKDYRDMMQQLPILEKQERIASITLNNQKYHMSKERLKEREQKNQKRMEGAYEKLFPKNTITIPSKPPKKTITSSLPFQTIDVTDNDPSLNVASWDIDSKPTQRKGGESELLTNLCCSCGNQKKSPKSISVEAHIPTINVCCECREDDADNVSKRESTTENLQGMLKSLANSRNKLAQELATLPEDSRLRSFLDQNGGLSEIDQVIEKGQNKEEQVLEKKKSKKKPVSDHSSPPRSSPTGSGPRRSKKKGCPYDCICVDCQCDPKYNARKAAKVRERSHSSRSSESKADSRSSASRPLPKTRKPSKSKSEQTVASSEDKGTSLKPDTLSSAAQTHKSPHLPSSTQTPPQSPRPSMSNKETSPPKFKSRSRSSSLNRNVKRVVSGTQTTPMTKRKDSAKKHSSPETTSAIEKTTAESQTDIVQPKAACDCKPMNVGDGDTGEIVIRFGEDGKPKIIVNPLQIHNKEIIVTTGVGEKESSEGNLQKSPKKSEDALVKNSKSDKRHSSKQKAYSSETHKPKVKGKKKSSPSTTPPTSPRKQNTSWRDYLNQNSNSTSTSYFSPPAPKILTGNNAALNSTARNKFCTPEHIRTYHPQFSYLLPKNMDPAMINYVKKLLTMSKRNVEELAVSSVSDISTPSSSIINTSTNIKVSHIKEAMQRLSVDKTTVNQVLNYSADESSQRNNTAESLTVSSFNSRQCNCLSLSNNAQLQQAGPSTNISLDQYCKENYEGVLSTYNQMADNYSKRIESLSSMIKKLRSEKAEPPLFSPSSEKDSSTKYLDFCGLNTCATANQNGNDSIEEQHRLDRYLLNTDFGELEQVQEGPKRKISKRSVLSDDNTDLKDSIDEELRKRFDALLNEFKTDEAFPDIICCPIPAANSDNNDQNDLPFIPVLLDIPHLPKFENENSSDKDGCSCKDKSKPPISKGIISVKRFNNDISAVPHELSTIKEVEMSSKIPMTPRNSINPTETGRNQSSTSDKGNLSPNSDKRRSSVFSENNNKSFQGNKPSSDFPDEQMFSLSGNSSRSSNGNRSPSGLPDFPDNRKSSFLSDKSNKSSKGNRSPSDLPDNQRSSFLSDKTNKSPKINGTPSDVPDKRMLSLVSNKSNKSSKDNKSPSDSPDSHSIIDIHNQKSSLQGNGNRSSRGHKSHLNSVDLGNLASTSKAGVSTLAGKCPGSECPGLIRKTNEVLTSSDNPYKQKKTVMYQQLLPVPIAVAGGTSDSSDELENMENMLKSLGMGWAVSTLRKTQEALNLQSSSSSLDISVKRSIKLTESNSSSDISFRDILSKQFLAKISSSSLKSDDSNNLSPFSNQFSNLTPIGNILEGSLGKSTQRTSTPIQSNKTTEKSKSDSQSNVVLNKTESDLSSNKEQSEHNPSRVHDKSVGEDKFFYSLNDDDSTLTRNTTNT